jgi:hypothetical protein
MLRNLIRLALNGVVDRHHSLTVVNRIGFRKVLTGLFFASSVRALVERRMRIRGCGQDAAIIVYPFRIPQYWLATAQQQDAASLRSSPACWVLSGAAVTMRRALGQSLASVDAKLGLLEMDVVSRKSRNNPFQALPR